MSTMSAARLKEHIDGATVTFLDYDGTQITEREMWEQFEDGYHVGFLVEPISNTLAYRWVVVTAQHKNHHGFDTGAVVEAVATYEDKDDLREFVDDLSNAGGTIWEVEA